MKPDQLFTLSRTEPASCEAPVARVRAGLSALGVIALAIASSVVMTLGGCASSAGIASKAVLIVPASVGLADRAAGATSVADALPADWWKGFGDPALTGLVERAMAENPSLKGAQARLARAQAAVGGVQATEGVQVNAALDVTRQRFSATSVYPPPLGGGIFTLGTAQVGAAWEFDFFGRNRNAIEAAVGLQRAAQADSQAARSVLASSVVRTYVQLGRLFEQREVAQRSLAQRDQVLALIRQRVQAGLDTAVEQRQGEAALPESRLQIEQLDEQIMLTRHALAALTAQAPNALDSLSVALRAVQGLALPAAVPADLLGRRADITAARWRVEAASSDTHSARAQFYPNINLTAFVGLSSIGLDRLVNARSEQYGFGPAIRLPIFDAGRLRANLSARTAELDAAIESYNTAVLDAVHDAADQIGSLGSIGRQQAEQVTAQVAAESAYELSIQRYKAGLGNFLTVLSADNMVLAQRRLATDLKARAIDVQVALIRALGGGYGADPADTAAAATAAAARPTHSGDKS